MGKVEILESFEAPGRGRLACATRAVSSGMLIFLVAKFTGLIPKRWESDVELVCPGNLSGITWGRQFPLAILIRRRHAATHQSRNQRLRRDDYGVGAWLAFRAWPGMANICGRPHSSTANYSS